MKNLRLLSILILMGVIFIGCQAPPQSTQSNQATQSQKNLPAIEEQTSVFPDFKVKTLDKQKEISLRQYQGKILILDLFATWCPPCRKEIPHFVDLQTKYPQQVAIVGLAYDQSSAKTVRAFAQKLEINYDLYWGSEAIAAHVGLRGIPHTLVIDPVGQVVRSYVGYRDKQVFEDAIKSLLDQVK